MIDPWNGGAVARLGTLRGFCRKYGDRCGIYSAGCIAFVAMRTRVKKIICQLRKYARAIQEDSSRNMTNLIFPGLLLGS